MEGASNRSEAGSLTRARRRRFWFSLAGSANVDQRGSATGGVRGTSSASLAAEKATAMQRRQPAVLDLRDPKGSRGRDNVTEAGVGPSSSTQPRPDYRKVVQRQRPTPSFVPRHERRKWDEGQRDASRALGSRPVHECSCRKAVADVGEKHLACSIEGSRKANQERTG
jgi:hypothetical protein